MGLKPIVLEIQSLVSQLFIGGGTILQICVKNCYWIMAKLLSVGEVAKSYI